MEPTEQVVERNIPEFFSNEDGTWTFDNETMPRKLFLQKLFLDYDLSRKDIGNITECSTSQVYSATTNLENSHHSNSTGRRSGPSRTQEIRNLAATGQYTRKQIATELGVSYATIYAATKDSDKVVTTRQTQMYEIPNDDDTGTLIISGPEAMRKLAERGLTRPEIADQLDANYGSVWAATKNVEVKSARSGLIEVDVDGVTMPRVEGIRMLADQGLTRREIATKLSIEYTVVWVSTKNHPTYAKADDEESLSLEDFTVADLDTFIGARELEVASGLKKADKIAALEALGVTAEFVSDLLETINEGE